MDLEFAEKSLRELLAVSQLRVTVTRAIAASRTFVDVFASRTFTNTSPLDRYQEGG